jgi:hypothetical protein
VDAAERYELTRQTGLTSFQWSAIPKGRAKQEQMLSFITDYLMIGGEKMPATAVASRLGVTPRTVCRWRRLLRTAGSVTCLPGACGPYVRDGGVWVCRKCGKPK